MVSEEIRPTQQVQNISQHLANERTYLAWLRTSFSLLTLGFATNKFGEFLFELHQKEAGFDTFGAPRRLGLVMVILGTILMAAASYHYNRTRNAINAGDFRPASLLISIISIMSVLFGIVAIVLLLQT